MSSRWPAIRPIFLTHGRVQIQSIKMWLAAACAAILLAVLSWTFLLPQVISPGHSAKTCAPCVPGLPIIGNVHQLARHGAAFIHSCRMQVSAGRIFASQAECNAVLFTACPTLLKGFSSITLHPVAARRRLQAAAGAPDDLSVQPHLNGCLLHYIHAAHRYHVSLL